MPELPEVETVKRGITPHLINQTFTAVKIYQRRLRWLIPPDLVTQVSKRQILSVSRRAKYLLIQTTDGYLIIHLGMTGRLYFTEVNTPASKHDHADFILSSGRILRFTDPRKFGALLWAKEATTHPLLSTLGVEPLSKEFNSKYLLSICAKRSAPIKQILMNSHIVVGIGNIYAQEALFRAGIHPKRAAKKITAERLKKLVAEVKIVLRQAIAQGGTTLKDFLNGDGMPGYFQQRLLVYGRGGEACTICSRTLKLIRQQQRSTVFCAYCQR